MESYFLALIYCPKNIAFFLYKFNRDFSKLVFSTHPNDLSDLLEIRYPFSKYAQQSVLDLAYAYYEFGQKDEAIAECDKFIDLYPNHPNLDYAYY